MVRPIKHYTSKFYKNDEVNIHYRDGEGNRKTAFGFISKVNGLFRVIGGTIKEYKYTCRILTLDEEHEPTFIFKYYYDMFSNCNNEDEQESILDSDYFEDNIIKCLTVTWRAPIVK